jgi:hypothetical protein
MHYDRATLFLFVPVIGELDRFPVGDVKKFVFSEYSVQHPRRAEQPDMAAMQRCQRPPADLTLVSDQDAHGLPVRGRLEQQVFDFVQGKADIRQLNRP